VLDELEALLLFVPAGDDRALERLPFGQLIAAAARRHAGDAGSHFAVQLPSAAQTLVVVGRVGPSPPAFTLLELAGRRAKAALDAKPATLGVAGTGLAARSSEAALDAGLAAAWAGAFEMPSFKSEPRKGRRLVRIVPIGRALPDTRRARVSAEATDLVRWLTGLPPDRLDPAGFRRAAQLLAGRHGLTTRFFGEAQLRRLGAGAFLAVTRGSARRNAGILQLRYRPRGAGAAAPVGLVRAAA